MMNQRSGFSPASSEARQRGATMLEFAFVLPILVLMFFAIVDFSRYYAICAVLRAGASDGLNRARKIPNFDIDWRNEADTSTDYQRFVQARNVILDETERTPFQTILSSQASPSDAVLRDITMTDNGLAGGSTPTTIRSSAVLRPGECATISGHGVLCNGPTTSTMPPGQLMEKHPIRVVMFAEVRPFLPFIGTLLARGEAYGYREVIPQGPLAGPVGPADVGGTIPGGPLPPVLPGAGAPIPSPTPYLTCPNNATTAPRALVSYTAADNPFHHPGCILPGSACSPGPISDPDCRQIPTL